MTITTTMSEYETGTYTGHVHPHNGYYAGDFGPRGACPTTRSASKARVTDGAMRIASSSLTSFTSSSSFTRPEPAITT